MEDEFRRATTTVSAWNVNSAQWEYTYQTVTIAEVIAGLFTYTEYRWQDGEWKKYARTQSQYNDHFQVVLSTRYLWDENAQDWLRDTQKNYYYGHHTITVSKLYREDNFRAFPNPACDYVAFESDAFSGISLVVFYNMQGKLVMSTTFTPGESISLAGMKAGYYLYRVQSLGKVFTGKLQKQ